MAAGDPKTANGRVADHPADPLFLERWSPRAFDASAIPEADLLVMLEAARWAPSAFNSQPWRFLYAGREDECWPLFLDLLIEWNRDWARNASFLLFLLSDTTPDSGKGPRPSRSHSFDAGAAWAQFALQASLLGYHAHAMTGADFDRARIALAVPERWCFEAAIAVGRRASADILPEKLRTRETPSGRAPVAAFATRGRFDGGSV